MSVYRVTEKMFGLNDCLAMHLSGPTCAVAESEGGAVTSRPSLAECALSRREKCPPVLEGRMPSGSQVAQGLRPFSRVWKVPAQHARVFKSCKSFLKLDLDISDILGLLPCVMKGNLRLPRNTCWATPQEHAKCACARMERNCFSFDVNSEAILINFFYEKLLVTAG